MKRWLEKHAKNLATVGLFAFVFFCLSGGPLVVSSLLHGAKSHLDARLVVTAPFFIGFIFTAFLGLLNVVKNHKVKDKVVTGFTMILFSIVGIELLMLTVYGRWM
jgi:hypothetical protein